MVLLILPVSPRSGTMIRGCLVCDHVVASRGKCCEGCGLKM